MFKLELLLLVLSEDVAELPLESSHFGGMKLINDFDDLITVGFTSCGILFGSLTGDRAVFAALDIFEGDSCEFPICVVFTGFTLR